MIQAAGFALLLVGAILWHIASGSNHQNITDVWKDILKTLAGEALV